KRDKDPAREMCRWNEHLPGRPTVFERAAFKLRPATPVVFHFHGHSEPESLVLTEDDYVWFLAQMIKRRDLLPEPISTALRDWSLLFIGYGMGDWNLRVWLRLLRTEFLAYSYMVVLPPKGATEAQARDYLLQNYGG